MRTKAMIAALVAVGGLTAGAQAATTFQSSLSNNDMVVQGQNRSLWTGKKGLTVRYTVSERDSGGFLATYKIAGKNNSKLRANLRRVSVLTDTGLQKVEKRGKKATVHINMAELPETSYLRVKGRQVRATALGFPMGLAPVIDPDPDSNGGGGNNNGGGGGGGGGGGSVVVPLPAAGWAGLATLGGMGLVGLARRRRSAELA
mgnify:CR=1 FL=1